MDIASLEVLVHGLDVLLILLGLPNGVPGLIEVAVLIGVELLSDQVTGQAVDLVGNPGLVAPAAVVQVAVQLRMQLLVLGQVGLEVFQSLDGGGIQANFVSSVHVHNVAHGNAQLLVGGNRVVDAVDLSTGDERGVQGIQDALAVGGQQVAVLALVIVQGQEAVQGYRTHVGLPVSGEEDIDLLTGLQRGQRLGIPIAPADDAELDISADQGLNVSIDRVLNSLAGVGVLVTDLVVIQGVDLAIVLLSGGSLRRVSGLSGSLSRLGGSRALGRSRSFGLCTRGHRKHENQRHEQSYDLLRHGLFLLRKMSVAFIYMLYTRTGLATMLIIALQFSKINT